MKAKLLLTVGTANNENEDELLTLSLRTPNAEYLLSSSPIIDEADKEDFLGKLEDIIQEAILVARASDIPLTVEDSVSEFAEFMPGGPEEIKVYVSRLVKEL